MATRRYRRGNRVYLAEYKSIREGKKARSKLIRYVDVEGEKKIESSKTLDRIMHGGSIESGAVRLLWSIAIDFHTGNNWGCVWKDCWISFESMANQQSYRSRKCI